MKTALLLVDIQNDFITGSLPVPDGAAIIDPVNRCMTDYEYVIATQDWHPATHFSFHTSHPGRKPFETIERDGESQTLWPPHCVQASDGAALPPLLDTAPIAAIFRTPVYLGRHTINGEKWGYAITPLNNSGEQADGRNALYPAPQFRAAQTRAATVSVPTRRFR